jgi:hypothetical protein
MPLVYEDLLSNADWYQSFNGNTNITTVLPYTLQTGATRYARTFTNDAPAGLGTQSMVLQSGRAECEYITSLTNAKNKPSTQNGKGATYEFWIKIPSGYTVGTPLKLLYKERTISGTQTFDRINLTSDFRVEVSGLNNGANGNGYYMTSSNIATEPLAFDTWHHISVVYYDDTVWASSTSLRGYAHVYLYHNGVVANAREIDTISPATQSSVTGAINSGSGNYSFGWDASGGIVFSGDSNDGGFFSGDNISSIPLKIAGFAMWFKSAQTNKEIARRYMYGMAISKSRQKALIEQSNPWFACDLNNVAWDGTTETFQNQFGSNVTSNGSWGTSLSNGLVNNLTLKDPGSLESNGITQTTTWINTNSGQIAFANDKASQLNAIHNSGNMSFETWVKWGWTKNNFKPSKASTGPVYNMLSTLGGVFHVIRTSTDGRIEIADRYNDSLVTASGNISAMTQKLITDNDWVHLATTYSYNGTTLTLKFFINGRLFVTRNITGNLQNPSWGTINQLVLFFAGQSTQVEPKTMDIFAIYDRTLSDSEVKSRYLSYAAVDRNVKFLNNAYQWVVPTANKYWNGSEWSFWNDKVKYWTGTEWILV